MPPSDTPAPRFVEPDPATLDDAQRAVWERMAGGPRGKLPTPYRIWIASPVVAEQFEALGLHLLRGGAFTIREAEIAILVSSVHADSAFVTAAHQRIATREGVPQPVIDALLAGAAPAFDDPREAMTWRLANALVRREHVDDALFVQARDLLGHGALAELTALLGYYAAVEMVVALYDVPAPTVAG